MNPREGSLCNTRGLDLERVKEIDMEITWDRIQALGQRLVKSRELEVAMAVDGDVYVVFTPGDGDMQERRTHTLKVKGPWDLECECPDYQYNDHLNGGFCKHVMAVLEYRGQHPVIVKTLADEGAAEAYLIGCNDAHEREINELWESKIKELY